MINHYSLLESTDDIWIYKSIAILFTSLDYKNAKKLYLSMFFSILVKKRLIKLILFAYAKIVENAT